MRTAAGIAKSALGGLGAGLLGGLSLGALSSVVKNVADFGDHLNDLSKATGASVEQLSFLDYAAKQSGSSIDGLTSNIGKMQKNLAEVARTGAGPAAKALATLDLNAKDLVRQDLVTQIGSLADALGKIQNPAERAALGQAVFGKGFREIAPLLSEGSRGISELADSFVELGGVVTKAQAEKFDALNDSLGNFRLAALGAGIAITDHLAGPLTSLFNTLAEGSAKAPGFFSKIAESLKGMGTDIIRVIPPLNLAASVVRAITGSSGSTEQFGPPKPSKEFLAARAIRSGTLAGGVTEGLSDAQAKQAERLAKSQDDYLTGLRKQLVLQGNATELAKTQADISLGAASKFDDETKKNALALANQIDLLADAKALREESAEVEKVMAGYVKERAELEASATAALAARRQTVIDSLQTPLEKYIDTVKELLTLGLGGEQLARGIKAARTEMETSQTAASALKGTAKDLGLTFTSAFEDAIVGAQSFGEVLKGLASDIARILIRKSVTEPLANAFGTFLGGLGGGGVGNSFAGFDLFNNAKGGLYKVGGGAGEHPVAFNARAGEVVAVGTGMGGGGALTVIIHEATPGTTARPAANGRDVEVFVGGVITKNAAAGRNGMRPPLASR